MQFLRCLIISYLSAFALPLMAQDSAPATPRRPGGEAPRPSAPVDAPSDDVDVDPNDDLNRATGQEMAPPSDPDESVPPEVLAPVGEGGAPVGVPQIDRDALPPAPAERQLDPPEQSEAPTTQSIIADRVARRREHIAEKRVFGSYRLHVMGLKPYFELDDNYKKIYGDTSIMPALAVDYFFFDWYATLGLTFRVGYYSDGGKALKKNANGDDEQDPRGKVQLTLIPLQIGLTAELTPFPFKWLVLSGWFGAETLYYQEVRNMEATNDDSKAGTSTSSSSGTTSGAKTDETSDSRKYTTSAWRNATVFGAAAHIRIDRLDQQASGSLNVIGMRAIYLSPYFEVAQKVGSEKFHLSRKTIGLGFTFETTK